MYGVCRLGHVDSAIRSETGSIFGESRVRSFASLVDSAIRSSNATEADLESSPVQAADRAMRSSSSGTDLGTSPFHVFVLDPMMSDVKSSIPFSLPHFVLLNV